MPKTICIGLCLMSFAVAAQEEDGITKYCSEDPTCGQDPKPGYIYIPGDSDTGYNDGTSNTGMSGGSQSAPRLL